MRWMNVGAVVFLLAATSVAAQDGDVDSRIQRVVNGLLPQTAFRGRYGPPARLAERLADLHTPGVSIAVIHDDRIDWARGFGVREAGSSDPVTPATVFEAGSVSKPVFAIAVMKLVEAGQLDLDRDVNDYLKSWKVPRSGHFAPRLTLRQLLSHSAGLTVHGFPGYLPSEPLPTLLQILAGENPSNTAAVEVNIPPRAAVPLLRGWHHGRPARGQRSDRQTPALPRPRAGLRSAWTRKQHLRAAAARVVAGAGRHCTPLEGRACHGQVACLPRDGRGRALDDAVGSRADRHRSAARAARRGGSPYCRANGSRRC